MEAAAPRRPAPGPPPSAPAQPPGGGATRASVLDARHRALTAGVLLTITVAAFQAMGVVTILPVVARDLGGLTAYGWAVSAFTLASIAGTVVAGLWADRRGAVAPYLTGLALFGAGSVLAAAARSWDVLLVARALQGAGNGMLMAIAYVAIARAYDAELHARMLALLSSAWIVPSIVGPALAGTIADRFSWRIAFLALLPVLVIAAFSATAGLRRVGAAPASTAARDAAGTLGAALLLVGAAALLLVGLGLEGRPVLLVGLVALALALGVRPLRRLLPAGTFRARPGIPAAVAVRAALAAAFLGMEAFVPLGLTTLRDLSAAQAGLVMTAGSLSWSAAAFTAARLDARDAARGRGRRLRLAILALAAGVAVAGTAIVVTSLPLALVVLGWCLAGGGIGASYATVAAAAFARTPEGAEGQVSSSLQLAETLAISVTTGALGALVGGAVSGGRPSEAALGAAFATGVAVALLGASLARRAAA